MTIFGWDMSHYDVPGLGTALAEGISFVTHKAGGDATDAELDDWWAGVKDLDKSVVLGAYWIVRPDTSGTMAAKADAFLARLDAACPGWRSRDAFILQLDCEKWNGDSGTVPNLAEINTFADRLVSRTSGKYVPIVYAPKWVYPNVSALKYPVWASAYVTGSGPFKSLYPGDSSSKWNAYGVPISILQYSSSATIGGQTTSDANAFKGSVIQLKQLVTPGVSVTQQLTTDDVQAIASKIGADLLNTDSNISKGLRLQVHNALNEVHPYVGNPGQRITDRGWGQVTPWALLEYLFETVAADDKTITEPDGTSVTVPGGIMSRLDRIENATSVAPADPSA